MKKSLKISIFFIVMMAVIFTTSKVMGVDDTPANPAFEDYNFYKGVIDAYNRENEPDVEYNHSLTDEELAKITSITYTPVIAPHPEPLTSVKGIEKLTNLKSLNLMGNHISTIDLSNNTKLQNLDLQMTRLTSIDISHNVELKAFYFTSTAVVNNINLENNTKLEKIFIGSELTSVDLSHQPELKDLTLSGAEFSSINLSSNPLLTKLDLSSDNLSNIDLSHNTLLTDLNLSNNNFTQLDLSAQNELTNLNVSNNKLVALDFSNITNLVSLNVRNNSLLSIKGELHNFNSNPYPISEYVKAYSKYNSNWPLYFMNDTNYFIDQKIVLRAKKSGDKYIVNLKEQFPDLDLSEIEDLNGYDYKTGIITISAPSMAVYQFNYRLPLKATFAFKQDEESRDVDLLTGTIKLEGEVTILIPPEISNFYIGGVKNPEYTNNVNSSVYLSWNDSNITHYCINTTNDSASCNWQSVTSSPMTINYQLTSGEGDKTLYAFIKNKNGLVSEVKSDTIKFDTTKPVISKFAIGGSANPEYITNALTNVYLTFNDKDVSEYCINTSNSSADCDWKSGTSSPINANYPVNSTDGEKTLYAFVKDKAGNISNSISDKVILDTTKPTITEFYLGGSNNPEYATDIKSKIYLTYKDQDVKYYCISSSNSSSNCNWIETNNKTIDVQYELDRILGKQVRYAYLKDKAGNVSEVKNDSIILQMEGPLIKEFYLGGKDNPEYATNTISSIYLTWDNSDVQSYCISDTDDSKNCVWHNVTGQSVSDEYVLTSTLELQTKYAFLKNKAGLISASKSDSITLQTENPLIKEFKINDNKKYTTKNTINIILSSSEELSAYCLTTSNDVASCNWVSTNDNNISVQYELDNKDGIKNIYAFVKNKEEKVSEVAFATVILDTTKPSISNFFIGGKDNPEVIENNKTNIYLNWQDDDVVKYCVNTVEDSTNCEWQNTIGKEIIFDYTLTDGDGEKTLYAFIQDEAGFISLAKEDKVTVKHLVQDENNSSNNNQNNNSVNNNSNSTDEKLDASPQTGAIGIGIFLVVGITIGLFYKYYLSKKNKIAKI